LGSYHNAKTSIGAEYDKNTDSNWKKIIKDEWNVYNNYTEDGFFMYNWLQTYLKDIKKSKIWKKDIIPNELDSLNTKDTVKWVKEMTNRILKPINSNWINNLIELESLLQKEYIWGKNNKFKDSEWNEQNIRFATSINFAWTTIIRDEKIEVKNDTFFSIFNNKSSDKLASTDALGFSSIPAAPNGWYDYKNAEKIIVDFEYYEKFLH
jgi:hypothetical protein